MKKILFSLLMFVCATLVKAQDMMVATLDGEAGTKVYYGADALVSAVNEAQSGDRITLSAGAFNSLYIKKSVKIQGAGFVSDPEKGLYKTTLIGNLVLELPEGDTDDFLLEGIYSDNDIIFKSTEVIGSFSMKKCRFRNVSIDNCATNNARIEHCRIAGTLNVWRNATNLSVINSVINMAGYTWDAGSTISYINTVIYGVYSEAIARFENCILYRTCVRGFSDSDYPLRSINIAKHCVSFVSRTFEEIKIKNDVWISNEADVFTEEIGGYSDTALYELTETAKETFVDADGDQIGIYGGYKPYSPVPSNPQILSRKISSKSSDGKLRADITMGSPVKTCEYWFDTDYENKKTESCAGTFGHDLDISGLSEGVHLLNIRFRDALGQWSSPLVHRFYASYIPTDIEVIESGSLDGDSFMMPIGAKEGYCRVYSMSGQLVTAHSLSDLSAGMKDLRSHYRDLSAGRYILRIEIRTDKGISVMSKKLSVP